VAARFQNGAFATDQSSARRATSVGRAVAFVGALLCSVSLGASSAVAQEEGDASLSRSHAAGEEPGPGDATPAPPTVERWTLEPDVSLGVFAGTYVQSGLWGPFVNVSAGARTERAAHRLRLDADFVHDPFSTRFFNFGDEDGTDRARRLVQALEDLRLSLEHRADWTPMVRTNLSVGLSERWSETPSDRSWGLEAEAGAGLGARGFDRGPRAELGVGAGLRRYPGYEVSDRRLDQHDVSVPLELAYSFGRLAEVRAGYTFELTQYEDARYDELGPSGDVVRADRSRSYLQHRASAGARLRPVRGLRITVEYALTRNDSRNYTRAITGQTADGLDDERLIRDYYDYTRHGLDLSVAWRPIPRLSLEVDLYGWTRGFDTYQARSSSNVWLGGRRRDLGLELSTEVSVLCVEGRGGALSAVAFATHLARRSNMKREVSFATNFGVSRVFAGLEYAL
jgi:hypothetical protein